MLFVSLCWAPASAQTILIASSFDDSPVGRLHMLAYEEAFRQLGLSTSYRTLPPARSVAELEAGTIDMDLARVYDFGLAHPALVRVEEPLMQLTAAAYSRNPAIELRNWEGLRGKDYLVEYRLGQAVFKRRLEAVLPAARINAIADTRQGLLKAAAGRTDIYFDIDEVVTPLLATPAFRDAGLRRLAILETASTYAYLHKRHASLAPQLAAVLRAMKANGTMERLRASLNLPVPEKEGK